MYLYIYKGASQNIRIYLKTSKKIKIFLVLIELCTKVMTLEYFPHLKQLSVPNELLCLT